MLPNESRFKWPPRTPVLSGYRLKGVVPGGVFVHGFRSHCDGEKAVALARHAARRKRAWLRYDQRHCGPHSDSFACFTVSQAVEDLVSIVDHFGQPVVLVGSSLGAVICLKASEQRPKHIRGLLLIAPAFRFVERHFASLPLETVDFWRRQGVLYFPDRYTGGRFPLRYAFYEDAIDFADLGPWNLDAPVAIVHGEHDELLPPEDSRELQRRIRSPSVSLDVVPGGDHRLNAAIALMCEKLDALWKLG